MAELITSAANPLAKRIRALADRRTRRTESAFVVEGIQPIWRALKAGADIETLIVAPRLIAGGPGERLLADAGNIPVAELSDDLFERLASKDSPSGVMAIVRGSVQPLAALELGTDVAILGLNEVANPGNLGTIIRTADSANVAAVVTIGHATDPLSPVAVKASMGSLFGIEVAHATDLDEFFTWCSTRGMKVTTTSAHATKSCWDADWTTPMALLLGSEGDGLSPAAIDRGDQQVTIPMMGTASSLNLAVAAGVLMFEARRSVLQASRT